MPPNDPATDRSGSIHVDARGMQCPWPALRAARAMRQAATVTIVADDPIAARELAALALQHGWRFSALSAQDFILSDTAAG